MSEKTPDLHAAYALDSPEGHKRLYAEWAGDYDEDFATREDYQLHIHTARAFVSAGGQGPVLDVGAGTGLCGAVLAGLGVGPIDATDISAEMLDQAMRKDIYRDAIEADLNRGHPGAARQLLWHCFVRHLHSRPSGTRGFVSACCVSQDPGGSVRPVHQRAAL